MRPKYCPQVSLPTQFNGQKQAPVGALSGALAKLQANRPLRELREIAKGITKQLPDNVQEATAKIDECVYTARSPSPSTLLVRGSSGVCVAQQSRCFPQFCPAPYQ